MMPWNGDYLFKNGPEDSREERCKQRITRAFEKATEDGVPTDRLDQWGVDGLASRLFDKIIEHFTPKEVR